MKTQNLKQIEKETSLLDKPVPKNTNNLSRVILEYTAKKLELAEEIHFEQVLDVFVEEFPEFVSLIAEENFMRGYKQGLEDKMAWEVIHES